MGGGLCWRLLRKRLTSDVAIVSTWQPLQGGVAKCIRKFKCKSFPLKASWSVKINLAPSKTSRYDYSIGYSNPHAELFILYWFHYRTHSSRNVVGVRLKLWNFARVVTTPKEWLPTNLSAHFTNSEPISSPAQQPIRPQLPTFDRVSEMARKHCNIIQQAYVWKCTLLLPATEFIRSSVRTIVCLPVGLLEDWESRRRACFFYMGQKKEDKKLTLVIRKSKQYVQRLLSSEQALESCMQAWKRYSWMKNQARKGLK